MNEYEVPENLIELNVKVFETYDEEWLDFILTCRQGKDTTDYDLVIGGIANDKIFKTIDLYFTGDITKDDLSMKSPITSIVSGQPVHSPSCHSHHPK